MCFHLLATTSKALLAHSFRVKTFFLQLLTYLCSFFVSQNDSEIIPFPNKNTDFSLSDSSTSSLCDRSFPRSQFINTPASETQKQEGVSFLSQKKNSLFAVYNSKLYRLCHVSLNVSGSAWINLSCSKFN